MGYVLKAIKKQSTAALWEQATSGKMIGYN